MSLTRALRRNRRGVSSDRRWLVASPGCRGRCCGGGPCSCMAFQYDPGCGQPLGIPRACCSHGRRIRVNSQRSGASTVTRYLAGGTETVRLNATETRAFEFDLCRGYRCISGSASGHNDEPPAGAPFDFAVDGCDAFDTLGTFGLVMLGSIAGNGVGGFVQRVLSDYWNASPVPENVPPVFPCNGVFQLTSGDLSIVEHWANVQGCTGMSLAASRHQQRTFPTGVVVEDSEVQGSVQITVLEPCDVDPCDPPPPPPPPPPGCQPCAFLGDRCCPCMDPAQCVALGGIVTGFCAPNTCCDCAGLGLGACTLWRQGGQCVTTTAGNCAVLGGLYTPDVTCVGLGARGLILPDRRPAIPPGSGPGTPVDPPVSVPDVPVPGGGCCPQTGPVQPSGLILPDRRIVTVRRGCAGCGAGGGL